MPSVESVITGAESEQDRAKRHRQRTLFDTIAERYEEFRPSYPSRVAEFVTTTANLAPGAAEERKLVGHELHRHDLTGHEVLAETGEIPPDGVVDSLFLGCWPRFQQWPSAWR